MKKEKAKKLTTKIQNLKSNHAITLIALIITIVVMLILVGVTLSIALGQNGVVNNAKEAKEQTEIATERERLLDAVFATVGSNGKVNLEDIVLPEGFTEVSSDETKAIYQGPSGKEYEVSKTTGDITEVGEKDLGEYYLRIVKIIESHIDATDEEWEEVDAILNDLSNKGKAILNFEIETGIESYYEYYYYLDGYIIVYIYDYRGEEEIRDAYLMTTQNENYDKVNAILKENLDILGELRNLLIGYTFTTDINYVEFEEYVENELGREFDFRNKGVDDLYFSYKSSIDDNTYTIHANAKQNGDSSYTIYEIS